MREVKSPWSLSRDDPRSQRGCSPGAYSSPSNGRTRSDSHHAVRSPGKGPAVRRPDAPVQGTGSAAEIERALDGSMRSDSRGRRR